MEYIPGPTITNADGLSCMYESESESEGEEMKQERVSSKKQVESCVEEGENSLNQGDVRPSPASSCMTGMPALNT